MTIAVDIWTDIACPWCFLGKRRFEKAIEQFGDEVTVEYHSYLLSPDAPTDVPGSHLEWLADHLGVPQDRARQMGEQMAQLGAPEGIAYDYDAIRTTNTRRAHELIHVAKAHGRQAAMLDRLSSAYFEQGRHLGQIDVLVDCAVEAGLDPTEAREALESGRYTAAVDADVAEARRLGIRGVPFFVIDGQWGVSGAQSVEAFISALRQVAAA